MSDSKFPSYPVFRLWTLRSLEDGVEYSLGEACKRVADLMRLSEAQRNQKLSSGKSTVQDRVRWALYNLNRFNLVARPKRGVSQITKAGMRCLKKASEENWDEISNKRLQECCPMALTDDGREASDVLLSLEDQHRACLAIRDERVKKMLDRLRKVSPDSFERIVLDLLRAMGYDRGNVDRGKVTGGSGDEGIDGWIQTDALGLGKIYMQAKRYDENNNVGPAAVREFIGALDPYEGAKGLFVTTSSFTDAAQKAVNRSPKNIVLIGGEKFALLMLQYRIGVIRKGQPIYVFDEIDESYFSEDEESGDAL